MIWAELDGGASAEVPDNDGETMQLVVDISRCDGCGACATVCPERIGLDASGFPVPHAGLISDAESVRRVAWAIWSCPRSALTLADATVTAGSK